jgi:hypothetical protein
MNARRLVARTLRVAWRWVDPIGPRASPPGPAASAGTLFGETAVSGPMSNPPAATVARARTT